MLKCWEYYIIVMLCIKNEPKTVIFILKYCGCRFSKKKKKKKYCGFNVYHVITNQKLHYVIPHETTIAYTTLFLVCNTICISISPI